VPSTGERPGDLYRQLATSLFINNEDSSWKGADINDLADTVKNRVMTCVFLLYFVTKFLLVLHSVDCGKDM
jgi:hypothetical protein